jgi:hypothetical protein
MTDYELFAECVRRANGWVVQTLAREYEAVYPTELVSDEHDRQLGEKLLSVILHSQISIRRTDGGYVCERR